MGIRDIFKRFKKDNKLTEIKMIAVIDFINVRTSKLSKNGPTMNPHDKIQFEQLRELSAVIKTAH